MKTMQRQFDKRVKQVHIRDEPAEVLEESKEKDTAE
jgi:hypothetical protein